MDGVFVTGTDTGVGKTTVCAGLLKLLHGSKRVTYWKPVQTGTLMGDDTSDVRELTSLGGENISDPSYRFTEPAAPYLAAKSKNEPISIDTMLEAFHSRQKSGLFQIVEGAGGILIPLDEKHLLIDFIKKLSLPVIVVGANKLGVINSTLLTIQACRNQGINVLGVILTKTMAALNRGNAECIQKFGNVDVIAEFYDTQDRMGLVSQVSCHPGLRKLFNVPSLPM